MRTRTSDEWLAIREYCWGRFYDVRGFDNKMADVWYKLLMRANQQYVSAHYLEMQWQEVQR